MSDQNKDLNQGRHLSFSLGAEEYAVPLLSVKEVIALPEITPVPFSPPHYLGLMNLRGQVISVVDLRKKMGIKPQPSAESGVIICDLAPVCLGVVVDSINSVLSPSESEISPRPEASEAGGHGTDFISHVYRKAGKLVLFLDIAKVLGAEDFKRAREAPVAKPKAAGTGSAAA